MNSIKRHLSLLCAALMLSGSLTAQTPAPAAQSQPGSPTDASRKASGNSAEPSYEPLTKPSWTPRRSGLFSGFSTNYRQPDIPVVNLANTGRLDQLIRGGNLYLSLKDTIALALENNLDIELARYGPQIAAADLLRAQAGGLLRGVPSTVQTGTTGAFNQTAGGATGGVGGGSRQATQSSSDSGSGGTVITQTGVSVPNLDPVFVSNFNFGHTSSPQSNTVTTGRTALIFDRNTWNSGVQQAFTSGTTVSMGFNNLWTTSNNPLSDINPAIGASLSMQVQQRLLQGFGFAVNNRNIRIAKNDQRISDLVFQQQVITTIAAVVNAYWDLVSFNEDVKVRQKAVELATKLYEDNKKQVDIGTLAPIEIVRAEAEVARAQQELTVSQTNLLQQETLIKNALSRTGIASPSVASARIIPTDRITIPQMDMVEPMQDLVERAIKNRPDVAQQKISLDNTRIGLAGSKSALLPSLDATLAFNNNALSGDPNEVLLNGRLVARAPDAFFVGGWGSAMGQLFRRNFPDYSIGVQLNIPLRNRTAQADYVRDQLQLRQQEIRMQALFNDIRVNVQNALIGMQQARARYETSVKARILQEQTLDAEQKKYGLGASTIFFVIQAQRDLAQAQGTEVSALSAYSRARTELQRVTGTILQNNDIEIREAMKGQVSWPAATLPVK